MGKRIQGYFDLPTAVVRSYITRICFKPLVLRCPMDGVNEAFTIVRETYDAFLGEIESAKKLRLYVAKGAGV